MAGVMLKTAGEDVSGMGLEGSGEEVEGREEVDEIWMSVRAATVFATTYWQKTQVTQDKIEEERRSVQHTIGFESEIISCSCSKNPFSITNSGFKSYSFATHSAAVFLT